MRYDEARRPRGGFTLVELLVALLISGILGAVIFQMMAGQSRIVAVQSAKEEAQQNVRGALEVISSELRGAVPAGLLSADAQALTFMQPRMWGFVCGGAGNTVTALFPTTGALALTPGEATGVMVNTGTLTAPVWAPLPPLRVSVSDIRVVGGPTATACADAGLNASGALQAVEIDAPGIGGLAVAKSTVMLYTMTRYDLAQVDGAWWLQRSNGMEDGRFVQQPLAGPVEREKVGFTYFANDPNAPLAMPVATPANVRMVRVQVVTNSSQTLNGRTQRDSGAVTVMLRNN